MPCQRGLTLAIQRIGIIRLMPVKKMVLKCTAPTIKDFRLDVETLAPGSSPLADGLASK
jgi:hypothetical protein